MANGMHDGEECWGHCGGVGGRCKSGYCGDEGFCCKKGFNDKGCKDLGCTQFHCCVHIPPKVEFEVAVGGATKSLSSKHNGSPETSEGAKLLASIVMTLTRNNDSTKEEKFVHIHEGEVLHPLNASSQSHIYLCHFNY